MTSVDLSYFDFKFNDNGLIPIVVQENETGVVLMLAWMNHESIKKTITTGCMVYWSRSREKFWLKGETSGNTQKLVSLVLDCDRDCLLAKVIQTGVACHTGQKSCFHTHIR